MNKTKRRFLSILLTLALILGLMPGMSLTAHADEPPAEPALTALSGTAGAYDNLLSYLFDKNISTKWYTDNQQSVHVIFKADTQVVMKSYMLTTGDDTKNYPDRNWSSWEIFGGNFENDGAATENAAWTSKRRRSRESFTANEQHPVERNYA